MDDEKIERTEVQANGGVKLNILCYVLFASIELVVIGLTIIVIWISAKTA